MMMIRDPSKEGQLERKWNSPADFFQKKGTITSPGQVANWGFQSKRILMRNQIQLYGRKKKGKAYFSKEPHQASKQASKEKQKQT